MLQGYIRYELHNLLYRSLDRAELCNNNNNNNNNNKINTSLLGDILLIPYIYNNE